MEIIENVENMENMASGQKAFLLGTATVQDIIVSF